MVLLLVASAASVGRSDGGMAADRCLELRLAELHEQVWTTSALTKIRIERLTDRGNVDHLLLRETSDGLVEIWWTTVQIDWLEQELAGEKIGESLPCEEIVLDTRHFDNDRNPQIKALWRELISMEARLVLDPMLHVHGDWFDVEIESGVSRTTLRFQVAGESSTSDRKKHPIEMWVQRSLDVLGSLEIRDVCRSRRPRPAS